MKKFSVSIDEESYQQLAQVAARSNVPGMTAAALARVYIMEGLESKVLDGQKDTIRTLVRLAVEDALKPSVNRLASITAKGSIISATATFLSLLVLNKVAGIEQERVFKFYEEAKKKAYLFVKDPDNSVEDI